MENKKKMILILVIMLAIGFATVSTTLVITGLVGIASKQDDFKVIFTNAILDNVERKEFIKGEEKQLIDYVSNELTTVNDTTTLEYEVTNTSRIYDAEVNIVCNIVDEESNETTSEYVEMKYTPNKMTVSAGETKSGSITAKLIKSSTEPQDIRIKCKLDATAIERDSLGQEYNEPLGTYELINDINKNNIADEGDEIRIGTERFYVISHTDTEINALAKYNLNVGTNTVPNATYGIQNRNAKGSVVRNNMIFGEKYGVVAFSNDKGWGLGENIDIRNKSYGDGPVKTALYGENGYEKYIKKTIKDASVRLITKSELEELGCDPVYDYSCLAAPEWVYSTSYWTQYADYEQTVWGVGQDEKGTFALSDFDNATSRGVRPVVTIDSETPLAPIKTIDYNLPAGVQLINDVDESETTSVGDEIAIGEEHFYVISKTDTVLNALAKYNLNVGYNKNKEVTEGIQHRTVRGKIFTGKKYGNVSFSNQNGWSNENYETIDIRNDTHTDGPVKEALYGENGYEKYIQKTISGASVRLIEKSELEALECSSTEKYCQGSEVPIWVNTVSYWTQTGDSSNVWSMVMPGITEGTIYSSSEDLGVRPVVTILLTSSDNEPTVEPTEPEPSDVPTKPYELVDDVDKNGTFSVGDEIKVGEEHFFVISLYNNNIIALAKYNLMVGNEYDTTTRNSIRLSNPTGIQDPRAKGYVDGADKYIGTVAFSHTKKWATGADSIYISFQTDGAVKDALYGANGYEKYIQKTIPNVMVRLITKYDLEVLGCDSSNYTCIDAPKWVYSTSYWTQTAYTDNEQGIWRVSSNGDFRNYNMYNSAIYNGVRPVITIPLS